MDYKPRRSVLFMPVTNARAAEKARRLPCDAIILDMEDAVAVGEKQAARDAAQCELQAAGFGARELIIRINGLDTEWAEDDAASFTLWPDAILIPKISTAEDVIAAEALLAKNGAPDHVRLWVMIETPLAILNIAAIAAEAGEGRRLAALVAGTNDLAKELGLALGEDRSAMRTALQMVVLGARAGGLVAIDGVYNDLQDADGFARQCAEGAKFGFDGKTLLHPNQIDATNIAFSPSVDEVTHARRVVEKWAEAEAAGKGVATLDGKMIEALHMEPARAIIAISDKTG